MDAAALRALIREIPDFPEPGISFKDITTLLADPVGFAACIDGLADPFRDAHVDFVVGIEARGFVFSAPVAHALGAGFIPIRKPGKLPSDTHSVSYELEYGEGELEIHTDAHPEGARCLVIDDVLATGGTALAGRQLMERTGADIVGFGFLLDLKFLDGREKLGSDVPIHCLISYED
jgi:adenine phosphoribosyltransferase